MSLQKQPVIREGDVWKKWFLSKYVTTLNNTNLHFWGLGLINLTNVIRMVLIYTNEFGKKMKNVVFLMKGSFINLTCLCINI